jgi:hypothetical protein
LKNDARFYSKPPTAYGVHAIGHLGYAVVIEWAGKLIMNEMSDPFVLGSSQHAAAMTELDGTLNNECVDLSGIQLFNIPLQDEHIAWTAAAWTDGKFYKILSAGGFPGPYLKRLCTVYKHYAVLCATNNMEAYNLVDAQLWYGFFALAI